MDRLTKERHLSQCGVVFYLNKLIEEAFEVKDAFQNGGYSEKVSEIADVKNVAYVLELQLEREYRVTEDKVQLDIENVIESKNKRTDEQLASGYYNQLDVHKHEYVDLADLSEGDREMVMNMIAVCRRRAK